MTKFGAVYHLRPYVVQPNYEKWTVEWLKPFGQGAGFGWFWAG